METYVELLDGVKPLLYIWRDTAGPVVDLGFLVLVRFLGVWLDQTQLLLLLQG